MTPERDKMCEALKEFCGYLSEKCPPLELVEGWERGPQEDLQRAWGLWMQKHRGLLSKPGVYAIYDKYGKVIYVGKASAGSSLIKRICQHDEDPGFKARPRHWIDFIPVKRDLAFLAPALEEFLIGVFSPANNRQGK